MPCSVDGYKICSKCGVNKPISHFNKCSSRKDGLEYSCRLCTNARIRVYKENHRDELRDKYKEYHKNHPEKAKERELRWLSIPENRIKRCERSKKFYWSDVENQRKKSNECKRTEKGKARVRRYNNTRRSNILNTKNDLSIEDIHFLLKFQNNVCGKCGIEFTKEITYTVDHIIPVKLGGDLTLQNCQLLCKSCNSSKGAKVIRYIPDLHLYGG